MDLVSPPRNRGCNVGVRLDLGEFIHRFFSALGSEVRFDGPGPLDVRWHSSTTSRRERFAIDHLANEITSKFDDGLPSRAKREKAVQRFIEGETLCSLTNCKFGPTSGGQPPSWLDEVHAFYPGELELDREVFRTARKIIGRLLGAFPGWDVVLQYADFGPGSTTRLPRRSSDRSNKWAGRPHVTAPLSSSLRQIVFDRMPLLSSRLDGPCAEICAGNKLDWVPKNYKTDRTIAIEPDWNMFLQKGLGSLVRRRLKRVKQDLDDQSVNRFLAALGSIDGSMATLDMSMASDTVAYRLVEYLIRPDWFEAFSALRTPVGFYDDESYRSSKESETPLSFEAWRDLPENASWVSDFYDFVGSGRDYALILGEAYDLYVDRFHRDLANNARLGDTAVVFEKFSSMGNGYTFELESLIFYGLLRAVSELSGESDHRLYVYGDDIVVPTGMAQLSLDYLRKAGFMVNPDKSFVSGPFRESCGGHYFQGDDVTPFYIREPVDSIDRLFLLHNNVYRWFNRHPGICDPSIVRDVLAWIRAHAPEEWRKPRLMSEDVGDGAFIGSFDEVTPTPVGKSRRKRGWEGWRADVLQFRDATEQPKAVKRTKKGHPIYGKGTCPDLASLWALESREAYWHSGSETAEFFLSNLPPSDLLHLSSNGEKIPYARRVWNKGTQVLPWIIGRSWW